MAMVPLTPGQTREVLTFIRDNPSKPVSAVRMIRDFGGGVSRCGLGEAYDLWKTLIHDHFDDAPWVFRGGNTF